MAAFDLEARSVLATGESAVLLRVDDKRGGTVEVLLSLREAMALASNLVGLVDEIVAADSAVVAAQTIADEVNGVSAETVARWAQIIREADVDDRRGALKFGMRSLERQASKAAAKRDRAARRPGAK